MTNIAAIKSQNGIIHAHDNGHTYKKYTPSCPICEAPVRHEQYRTKHLYISECRCINGHITEPRKGVKKDAYHYLFRL